MSETGLRQFDETLQATHLWLKDIMADIGPDRHAAYHALKAVLQTLRDRLTVDEAAHLGAQLPLLLRGAYYDGFHPAGQPHKSRTCDEFLQEVRDHMDGMRPVNVEEATRTVLKVLENHVSPGEVQQVKHMLPEEIRSRLWQ